jgi:Ca-activated chloride channel family protein
MTKRAARKLAAVFALALTAHPATACEVELILAMDVSRSVINVEYNLQMQGLAAAFRDPTVKDAIGWTDGGIMATVTQWSGPDTQIQSVKWTAIRTAEDADAFARAIESQRRKFFSAYTAPGDALRHAAAISARNPVPCRHKVIDVSGDGAGNRGALTRAVADQLVGEGFTINGLVIIGAVPDPLAYYAR